MHDILDLDRYPLDRPETPEWEALAETCRADLARAGMFNLEGFLRPEAIATARAELLPVFERDAFTHTRRHNIYFRKDLPLPDGHPALREVETTNRTICADSIGGGIVTRIYEWAPFATFLARTMDKQQLFTMDDPLARVNCMSYGEGQLLNWHFDRSEFTTTLLIAAPEAGGAFEYRTDLRSDDDPNYDGVARMLSGEDPLVRSLTLAPGTLNVFRGKNTAHRTTPVIGKRPRIIAVYSYYERPGVMFTDEERIGFYGRAA